MSNFLRILSLFSLPLVFVICLVFRLWQIRLAMDSNEILIWLFLGTMVCLDFSIEAKR